MQSKSKQNYYTGRKEYWEAIFQEWKVSGLTKALFCKQKNIASSSLHKWIKRLEKSSQLFHSDSLFLPITVRKEKTNPDSSLILLLKGGVSLSISEHVNKSALKIFLEVLGVLPC